jgi:hypothetical protein
VCSSASQTAAAPRHRHPAGATPPLSRAARARPERRARPGPETAPAGAWRRKRHQGRLQGGGGAPAGLLSGFPISRDGTQRPRGNVQAVDSVIIDGPRTLMHHDQEEGSVQHTRVINGSGCRGRNPLGVQASSQPVSHSTNTVFFPTHALSMAQDPVALI